MKLYIEGGGSGVGCRNLHVEMKKAFAHFFEKAGLTKKPRLVACGSRNEAFDDFNTAFKNKKDGDLIALLVDSEEPVETPTKWQHVIKRDGWKKPQAASEEHLYFMVVCMESWFLADKDALAKFFGHEFNIKALPQRQAIESVSKKELMDGLENATRLTQKGVYNKGQHSFKILATLDPVKVKNKSKHLQDMVDYFS